MHAYLHLTVLLYKESDNASQIVIIPSNKTRWTLATTIAFSPQILNFIYIYIHIIIMIIINLWVGRVNISHHEHNNIRVSENV